MSPRERQVSVRGDLVHVVDAGKRSESGMVVVPGFPGGDHMTMRATPGFENLEGEFRVVYYDPRGTGHSSTADGAYPAVAEQAADLAQLIDDLNLERPIVVTHDAGAVIATQFAIDHPAELAGLVLICPRFDLGTQARLAFESTVSELLEDSAAGGLTAPVSGDQDVAFRASMDQVLPLGFLHFGLVERTFKKKINFQRQAYDGLLGAPIATDIRDRLSDLRVPTLVLFGRYDPFLDLAATRELAGRLPHGRFVLMQGAAHWPFLEEPTSFSAIVSDWAEEVAAHIV